GPTQGIAPPAGCSTPTYQFYLQAPGGSWTVAQAWSSSSTWTWDTSGYRPGTYNIDAWANQAGDSTANAESFALTQWSIPLCSSASVTSNTMSPQPSGAQVVISAPSSCPNPNPETSSGCFRREDRGRSPSRIRRTRPTTGTPAASDLATTTSHSGSATPA